MSLYNFLVGVYLPKLQDNNYKHNEYQSSNFNLWYHIIERIGESKSGERRNWKKKMKQEKMATQKTSTARKTTLLNIHKSQVLDRNFFYVCLNYFEFKLR
jgi:hypothetical protein